MKILILGITGMLGHMAYRVLSEHHEVYGTCRDSYDNTFIIHEIVPRQNCFEQLDILETSSLVKLLQELRPQVIINAIGIVKQKKEAKDPIPSIKVNALFPHEVAQLADEMGAKLIQISTDCVFSGHQGMYTEDSPEDPVDIYGRSKLLGEVRRTPHLTLRTSIIGRQLQGHSSLIEWFIAQKDSRIKGFKYAIYSGLTTQALCHIIAQILEKNFSLSGRYHVASEPISKYDLLTRLNQMMQLNINISPEVEFRCDRSLDGQRFTSETGLTIPSWEMMLSQLVSDAPSYEIWRPQKSDNIH